METTKLPKEFKEKWLKALRSGEYKQGKRTLRKDDLFCCLGVACDIMGYSKEDTEGGCYIPTSFERVPKILRASGEIPNHLGRMNDNKGGMSFSEIADYIEENL